MTDLRERIAEALTVRDGATYAAVRCPDLRLVDAVMVEVQRDLDELEAAVADAQPALLDAQDEDEATYEEVPDA